jgi:hypothetical protein
MSQPDKLGMDKHPHEASRLLQRQKAQWVAYQGGYTTMLSAHPVQEQVEDQQPEERFRLSTARGEVKQACGKFIAKRIELIFKFRHPRGQRWQVRENECQLKQSPISIAVATVVKSRRIVTP